MGTPEEGSTDPRVQRTRRDVVEAATALFRAEGWAAVTHAEVARRAGYSKVTVYTHWPTRLDLVRASVGRICGTTEHAQPTGDLRADLIGELVDFAEDLSQGDLTRVLGGVLERAGSDPAVDEMRQQLFAEGAGPLGAILGAHLPAESVDPCVALLTGGVLVRVALQGLQASREFVEDLVDRVLASARQ